MVPLGLFSDLVTQETKQKMVVQLQQQAQAHEGNSERPRSVRHTQTAGEELNTKTLDFFIGPASNFLFEILQIDTAFLSQDIVNWPELPSYISARNKAASLKVINDSAERAIALATTFNSSLTKQEEQKQFLFQVVEEHRKRFPNCKKTTLLK